MAEHPNLVAMPDDLIDHLATSHAETTAAEVGSDELEVELEAHTDDGLDDLHRRVHGIDDDHIHIELPDDDEELPGDEPAHVEEREPPKDPEDLLELRGSGWYRLPDGETVRGKAHALQHVKGIDHDHEPEADHHDDEEPDVAADEDTAGDADEPHTVRRAAYRGETVVPDDGTASGVVRMPRGRGVIELEDRRVLTADTYAVVVE